MVVAGPRGLLAGGLRIVFQNGTEIDIGKTSSGVSIPEAPYEIENIQTDAQFIMIVEKNSVFHHLTQHQFFDRFPKGILLSSSGYPSQAFSDFLVLLRVNCPEAPILFLVDADPYGVHIALCHLQSLQKEALSSLAFWIGISVEDVERVKYDATLSITARDRAKAQKLLQMLREVNSIEKTVEAELSSELERILTLEKKAEIEALCESIATHNCFLCSSYLPQQFIKYIASSR
ncbi:DNA topoisomerase VI subunit A isoform 1 [Galdieria sulphuraria]|uniref:DNA topoisomerase VI subunit A isoform 1 n=1 Tax=Galdieria sulphuraria TaxID=130081 RepID=M2W4Y1_GALSU|nr:DNA topoisomerase VI subunit A isoform 1 [Galdieria sulphuraria]EME30796.1 DNA topoisomerase VI subunit A isoform 1 [Galdieria sulphuraria]|eukprot:XP_005707316.1 DNA topoisomerase VI subunit A isoform 1 [Galdieria sulphuraria]